MSSTDEMDRAVAAHFEMPPDIARLARLAEWDLYFGPICGEDDAGEWPGFVAACAAVSEWCDDNLGEVWYDIQSGGVLDREPEGYWIDSENYDGEEVREWVEPFWEDYYHLEASDVKRALFSRELVVHI